MKKFLFSLLTFVTAAGAVTGIAACSMGKTGGGDVAARSAKNSVTESMTGEEQPDMAAPDGQNADVEFGFLPPDSMAQGEPMPLPLPPQGRIFAPHVRHPEILHDAPMAGSAKEGAEESSPKGKMPRRKGGRNGEKGDIVTPDGSILPQVRDTDVKPGGSANGSCPNGCPDSSCPDSSDGQEEAAPQKSAADKSAEDKSGTDKRTKDKKGRRKKPDAKEKKGLN